MSDEKPKFPRELAARLASELLQRLEPACLKISVAGSLRRGREQVGDVELVYVPRILEIANPDSLFGESVPANGANLQIERLEREMILGRRLSKTGNEAFGAKNKLMRHIPTGIPIDLFETTEESWFNYLVCRTGGAENNIAIAEAARKRGCRWTPYGPGFVRRDGSIAVMNSEEEVFAFVGLPYLEPSRR